MWSFKNCNISALKGQSLCGILTRTSRTLSKIKEVLKNSNICCCFGHWLHELTVILKNIQTGWSFSPDFIYFWCIWLFSTDFTDLWIYYYKPKKSNHCICMWHFDTDFAKNKNAKKLNIHCRFGHLLHRLILIFIRKQSGLSLL